MRPGAGRRSCRTVRLPDCHAEGGLTATGVRGAGFIETPAQRIVIQTNGQAFTPEQLYVLTNLAIKSHHHGYTLALLFFGFTFLFHGYLIFRSGFLPKVLGIMIQIAGLCYLTNSFIYFLAPAVTGVLFPWILLPCFVAELSLRGHVMTAQQYYTAKIRALITFDRWEEAFALVQKAIAEGDIHAIIRGQFTTAVFVFQHSLLHTPGLRIAGGTDEILRNIIAERVLGLPGDARVDKDVPFTAIPTGS